MNRPDEWPLFKPLLDGARLVPRFTIGGSLIGIQVPIHHYYGEEWMLVKPEILTVLLGTIVTAPLYGQSQTFSLERVPLRAPSLPTDSLWL